MLLLLLEISHICQMIGWSLSEKNNQLHLKMHTVASFRKEDSANRVEILTQS